METDKFDRIILSEDDIFDALMKDPDRNLSGILSDRKLSNTLNLDNFPSTEITPDINITPLEFHKSNQCKWKMPQEYDELDIAEYILNLCKTDTELQRVGTELLLYYENDAFGLLRYLKYLSDVIKENNIVIGVGRGSCTASYILYLLGIHRIDSIHYDLPVSDFFKEN